MSQNPVEDEMKANSAATKIQAGFRGYRVRKQLKDTKPRRDISSPDITKGSTCLEGEETRRTSLEEKSATKIQAGIRGFLVRKRQQVAQAAATRIQAGFRGFRTRKALKQKGHLVLGEEPVYVGNFVRNSSEVSMPVALIQLDVLVEQCDFPWHPPLPADGSSSIPISVCHRCACVHPKNTKTK